MSPEEHEILESLDAFLQSDAVRAGIDPIVERVRLQLAANQSTLMAWEPIPRGTYGESLPALVRSSWVFILRAGATTGAERHPNSHQRMMSFRGIGDAQTGGEGCWKSNPLISNPEARIEDRWISIPINVWHQMVVPDDDDWVVVSFHSVPAEELIEERPRVQDTTRTQQRKYLGPSAR